MASGNVIETKVAVVGAGPAGLSAAGKIADLGGEVTVFDENSRPGGQLFKQIHKFFGSSKHGAGERGIHIGQQLLDECKEKGVNIYLNSIVYGIFPGNQLGVLINGKSVLINGKSVLVKTEKILIATGATEKAVVFEGWDKPGVMGAGAFQTMMNVQYVLPGKNVLIVGSGNVGLVIAYQILQAGGSVAAVVEAGPSIGGYQVHADKLKRQGVEILTSWSVKRAIGNNCVEQAEIARVDSRLRFVEGTERILDVDCICLAVGLTPSVELLKMAGVKMTYLPAAGGFIPLHNEYLQTSDPSIYVAGDSSGIEEASSAMEEGRLSAVAIAEAIGCIDKEGRDLAVKEEQERLSALRQGKGGAVRKEYNYEIVRRYREWEKTGVIQ